MRKLFLLPFLFLAAIPAYGQTSANGRIMEGPLASRPAVCTPGDYYVSTDTAPVVEYKCSTGNNWAAEATGGGGGGTSAGTNGTVQCGDGAGNFIACHLNDNVTFPGALFVNENFIVSGNSSMTGSLSVSGNGNAGNVPIKPNMTLSASPVNDSIIYVSPNGNDSNDGASWGTAKLTILGAYNALPGKGGTIYITGDSNQSGGAISCVSATPVAGQGIGFAGVHDPNFGSMPQVINNVQWVAYTKFVSIIGIPSNIGGTSLNSPGVCILAGNGTTDGIMLSGSSIGIGLFNLIEGQAAKRGLVIGENSAGGRTFSGGIGAWSGLWIDNSTFSVATTSTTNGPAIDCTGGSFQLYFNNFSANANQTATINTNAQAAMLMDGASPNGGCGLATIRDAHLNGGGLRYTGQPTATNINVDGVLCEAQLNGDSCVHLLTASGVTAHINNVDVADCTGTVAGVQVDPTTGNPVGTLPDNVQATNINSACTKNIQGEMIGEGQWAQNLNALPVSPVQEGQVGIIKGHVIGQEDAARSGFGPVSVRFPNIVLNQGSWTITAGGTLTTGIAAPDGTTGAVQGANAGGSGGVIFYPSTTTAMSIGDYFFAGAWVRSQTLNGYSGISVINLAIGNTAAATILLEHGAPWKGDGEWEWVWQLQQVTAVGATPTLQMNVQYDSTHTIQAYGPVLLHISTGTISANEAFNLAYNLQSYSNLCTVGQFCTPQGVFTGGGGSLPSGTQGEALVNNNGANGYQTTPAYLDCSAFTAADWGLIAQSCLTALNALNSQSGIADMRGVSGGTTASVNPMGGTMPASGTMLLGPGSYLTNVSFVKHSDWSVQGVSVRGVDGQVGTTIKAGASFQGTYTTGTITVGTPGANEVITGSGTTWTASMKGCNFYGANGGANSTFGIIAAVGGTTSLTLGWGQNLGTGAAGGSAYTIACGVGVDGSGGSSSAGDQFGMWDTNINYDCNNVAGAMGLVNWFGNQGTGATNLGIHNCNNIGLDLENQIQNSGPWNNVTISAGSGCSASTLLLVVHGNQNPFKGINGLNLSRGACATSPAVGGDIDENGTVISGADIASVGIGLLFGANTTCPVVCAMPGRSTSGWEVDNLYAESTVTTAVENSNAFSTNSGWQIRNIVNTGTNALIDLVNSCTDTSSRLANYVTNSAGAIAVSTSSVSTCKTWNIPALVAAAITDSALTAGQSVCAGTGGLLATSGCPPVTLANRVVSGTTATDTILAGDCFNRVTYQTSVNVAVTLPTPTTLGIAGCALRLVNATTGASTAITVTPTTLTIGPGATSSWVIQKGQFSTLTVDGTNWDTDNTFASTTNCASSASPAVCGAAAYGSVAIPTGAGSSTLTINTTAVTANSVIMFYPDDTLGTKLGVTCNSTLATLVGGSAVTARTAGTSFQITFNGTIATNPVCGNYEIVN